MAIGLAVTGLIDWDPKSVDRLKVGLDGGDSVKSIVAPASTSGSSVIYGLHVSALLVMLVHNYSSC